ncbi:signal peptide peptidase SppA [Paludisphaera borealis]|uniref:Protease 4 n=1 Tax=Paludisphaera borealis TaxID=1387353 RepID=A0A1U7CQY0_9BACT|nr:signal peptide peptidase SppA [Paludisphaera borealis]APW61350.1 Protease 4 [Paludisphaera borealis]
MSSARKWMKLAVVMSAVGLAAPFLSGAARAQDKPHDEAAKAKGAEVKKDEKKVEPPKARIAVFRLAAAVKETPTEEIFNFGGETGTPLWTLVERLDKAAADPAVKAVVVLLDGATIGAAQVGELRQAFDRVKAAGKELIGHTDTISSLGQYTLLSGAGRVSAVPTADVWATGLYGETPYLRGLLEKLGVKPDFLTCGDYKSAAEIFMREGPSKEAEAMQNWLLDSLYDTQVARIAASRKVSPELVKAWIDSGPHSAEKAKELGMLDAVEHRQDLEARLKKSYGDDVVFDRKYGKKAEPRLDASSPFGILKFWGELLGASKPVDKKKAAIGVVYVDGPIVLNASSSAELFQEQSAASTEIRKALNEAAADDAIKAVVLRVDSPGGSALASEIILDATRRVKAKKPFTVSMGNVAGSGGYYVACGADTVFADDATITGSIGVVGGKLATGGMYDKIGVKFKASRRGQNAGMLSSGDVFTQAERIKMQSWMDEIYGVFKGHVTAIRGGKLKKPIDDLAGGRVYTGKQALALGLVDRLGTLHDAVKFAADAAKITEYDVRVVPRPKSALERLLDQSAGDDDRKGLDVAAAARPFLISQALPLVQALDPAHAAVVIDALGRLELVRREGVVLMAPELGLGR